MFTVAAVLPFLPLIEDAMIRQLGDDDFAKREAATRFLEKVLQGTASDKNYPLFLKIEEARNNTDAETRLRIRSLYKMSRSKSILGHARICVAFRTYKIEPYPRMLTTEQQIAWQKRLIAAMRSCDIQDWPAQGWRRWCVLAEIRSEGIEFKQLIKLKNYVDTLWIKPVENHRNCDDLIKAEERKTGNK